MFQANTPDCLGMTMMDNRNRMPMSGRNHVGNPSGFEETIHRVNKKFKINVPLYCNSKLFMGVGLFSLDFVKHFTEIYFYLPQYNIICKHFYASLQKFKNMCIR